MAGHRPIRNHFWHEDELPSGRLRIWRGSAASGVREVVYVPAEQLEVLSRALREIASRDTLATQTIAGCRRVAREALASLNRGGGGTRVAQRQGAVDPMRESRVARARGLAQAIAECRDDARLDGIREGAAEIADLLGVDR